MRAIDADRLKYVISCAMDIYKQTSDASDVAEMNAIVKLFFEFMDGAPSLSTRAALDEAYQKGREDALKESACK